MNDRMDAGKSARDHHISFGEFAQLWLESSLPASDRRPSTQWLYENLTRGHILGSDLARVSLRDLRPSTVERFVMQLRAKGLSSSSVRQIYTIGRAIGDAAVRDGLVGQNSFVAVRRPRIETREAAFLTPDQVRLLLEAAEESRYHPFLALLVHTGLRRGEALALTWRDIDLEARTLRVRATLTRVRGELALSEPKTARSRRTVPLSEPAVALLRRVRERTAFERRQAMDLWVETGFVFVTDIGEPIDPRNALRALEVARRKAGLKEANLHTLRHSAASVMLTNGVPIPVVSKILGHSGISITVDVYGHVSPEVSHEALNVLAEALSAEVISTSVSTRGLD
jgi:integrase